MTRNNKENKGLLVFDLDGTIYKFKGGSFRKSELRKKVLQRAKKFISKKTGFKKERLETLLDNIEKEFGENISLALEKKFGINRQDYFNFVWNIKPRKYIRKKTKLAKTIESLKRHYEIALLSDAPQIWINRVLKELKLENIFFQENIFSGEGNNRKNLNNAFEPLFKIFKVKPNQVIVFGDQEKTDIIPAKKAGAKTVFVNNFRSPHADFSIKSISKTRNVIDLIQQNETLQIENRTNTNYRKILKKFLEKQNGNVGKFKKLLGSSRAETFLIDKKIYKIINKKDAIREINSYRLFKKNLKKYKNLFPNIKTVLKNNEVIILKIDYIGRDNFEDLILSFAPQDKGYLQRINMINRNALKKLSEIYEQTKLEESYNNAEKNLFFEEVISAIRVNLNKSGLRELQSKLLNLKRDKKEYLKKVRCSLIHKDLSPGNIVVKNNKQPFFIDPRRSLPYLTKKQSLYGNIAFDLAMYWVSILRKEEEIRKKYPNFSLAATKTAIIKEFKKYRQAGVFNKKLQDLAIVWAFSVFAACQCDYCLDPSRVWLYKKMVMQTKKRLEKL